MRWNDVSRFIKTALVAGLLLAVAGFALIPSSSGQGPALPVQSPAAMPSPAHPSLSPGPAPLEAAPGPSNYHVPGPPPFFVMIDPGHGGDDPGVNFGGKLFEKDVTLALGRRLKSELHERGIPARLVRDSDVTLTLDQRAVDTNEQGARVYVSLHAGLPGYGVRVYTTALPSPTPASTDEFLPWETAQTASLPRSRELAQRIATELGKRSVRTTTLATPLRPLNNIVAPAVAVELAPSGTDIEGIKAQKFQFAVAAGIAAAIAQLRPQLEGPQ